MCSLWEFFPVVPFEYDVSATFSTLLLVLYALNDVEKTCICDVGFTLWSFGGGNNFSTVHCI